LYAVTTVSAVSVSADQGVLEDAEEGLVEICATLDTETESDVTIALTTSDDTGKLRHAWIDTCRYTRVVGAGRSGLY
jgi:hypothetical protein